jgi:endonuclease/exonuclease/phosphatase family metal-dependent hydrolase
MKVKFATYNICHCGDYRGWKKGDPLPVNVENIAKTIADLHADVVGLNEVYTSETKNEYREQTERLAKLAGYPYCTFAVGKTFEWGAIGNAVLSKYPITAVKTVAVPAPLPEERVATETNWYEDRVLLCVEIDVNGKKINVISSHFGLNSTEQRRIVDAACKEIDEKQGDVVFMGDFNVQPDSEFLSPLYARLNSAAKETGNSEFTFASYAPKIQIDYIFFPKTATVKGYTVYKSRVSDHRPISAEIEF